MLLLGQLGLTLGLPARAAVPDRHALRPVRDARARGDRLLDLLRLAVRARRHAVGHLALPRGRRAPVDHHARDRDRDAGRSPTPSRATRASSNGCCSTRSTACRTPDGEALYLRLSTKPIDQAPFAAAVERVGEERLRRTSSRAASGSGSPAAGDDRVIARGVRRDRARGARGRRAARRRGGRRGDRALPLLARPALPRLAAPPRRRRCEASRAPSHLERLAHPGRARPARRHGDRRRQPCARLPRQRARPAACRSASTASARPGSPRSTPSTGSTRGDRHGGARRARARTP